MRSKVLLYCLVALMLSSMIFTVAATAPGSHVIHQSYIAAENNLEPVAAQQYWGSSQSDKFHYPSCRWAKKIYKENLIVFKSRQEALQAGYVPCKVCKP